MIFPDGSDGKASAAMRETRVWFLGWEDPVEKVMAPHSSTLAWKIPWTEEPGRLQSVGLLRVGHDWTTERLHFSLSCIGEGNGNPLQCSCLENPRDGGAWRAAVYGVAQSRTRLKRLSSSSSRFVSYVTFINSNQFLFFMKQWKFPWKHVNNTLWRPYHFSDFTV